MKRIYILAVAIAGIATTAAQEKFGQIQNLIPRNKDGITQFDVRKDSVEFKGVSIDIGSALALQFQGLKSFNDHEYTRDQYRLNNLTNNFNLPCANMTIGSQLYDGVRVNLEIYLAARHHNDTWVKGGYLQIDKLDFIEKDFLSDFMKYATIKVGYPENNYGDAHFRRSDNGNAIMNPFFGNNIMDSFLTDMGAELYYNRNGFVSMFGITNSKLNQNVQEIVAAAPGQNTTISPTFLVKLGYDKQIDPDLRVRLTGSLYHTSNSSSNLYASDRAGSRFYGVMTHAASSFDHDNNPSTPAIAIENDFNPTSNYTTGRFNPGFGNWARSVMVNPFVKYQGLELFATLEFASGGDTAINKDTRTVNQYEADLVYRFGASENLFVGGKYNTVSGKLSNAGDTVSVNRIEACAGWFMTKNILAKLGYVSQEYKDFSQFNANGTPNDLYGGKFNGIMFEAVISF